MNELAVASMFIIVLTLMLHNTVLMLRRSLEASSRAPLH